MEQEKINEILEYAEELISENCNLNSLANDIMMSYIFGEQSEKSKYNYGTSEHYQLDEILSLVQQKYNEMFPPEEIEGQGE